MEEARQLRECIALLGYKAPEKCTLPYLRLYYHSLLDKLVEKTVKNPIVKETYLNYQPLACGVSTHWREHLLEFGWVVLDVPSFPLQEVRDGFFSWLERNGDGFHRSSPETWRRKNIPYSKDGSINHSIGHAEFMWKAREACYPIFCRLWGESDLLSSFEGVRFLNRDGERKVKNKMCSMQSGEIEGLRCVQGVVNLYDSGPRDGGILLMNSSHKKHAQCVQKDVSRPPFNINPFNYELSSCSIIKPCVKAGQILLFDARTFNCVCSPLDTNPHVSINVCMAPRRGANTQELQKRIHRYLTGYMSNCWCYGSMVVTHPLRPERLYSYYPKVERIEIAQLNSLRKRLVGY